MSFIEKSYLCEYIDIIPHSWKKTKIKHTINNYTNGAWGTEPKNDDNDIICIRIADFDYPKGILKDVNYTIRNIKINKMLSLEKGNLLIEKSGGGENQPVGRVIYFNKKFKSTFSNFITKIEIKKEYNPKFIYYVFRTLYNSKINTKSIKQTTGIQNLDSYAYFNEIILTPPLNEQEQIAKYLDNKTQKIEQNITKNKQLITLLKEKRTTLINQTVTKGLKPDIPMKESGIGWIGKIPEEWKINKIKNLCYVKGRIGWHGLTSEEYSEEGAYLVTGTDFKKGKINWETCHHISYERYKEDPYIHLKVNDLLITKDGTIGKLALVKNLLNKSTLNSGIFLVRPLNNNEFVNEYLYWILSSDIFSRFYDYIKTGATISHLYQETFERFFFPYPSIDEQLKICKYLDIKTYKIDKTIEKIEKNIELLEEYKESLIHHVVTGKIDVRGVEV